MKNDTTVQKVASLQRGQKVPVLSLISDTPESIELASNISKLVRDRYPVQHTEAGTREIRMPDIGALQQLSADTGRSIRENETIHEALPDNEAVIQLLVSSVCSPKDLMNVEINYNGPQDILPASIAGNVIQAIRTHFDNNYKIKQKLPKILREVLFTKGSHILAVLPENAVDDLINRDSGIAIESLRENKIVSKLSGSVGILGPRTLDGKTAYYSSGVGLENITHNWGSEGRMANRSVMIGLESELMRVEHLTVTDNPQVLKLPMLSEKLRKDTIKQRTGVGMESMTGSGTSSKIADQKLMSLIYKAPKGKTATLQTSKGQNQLTRRAVTEPLVLKLPSESVIPVYVPGDPSNHKAYFVLIDGNGYPVSSDDRRDGYRELANQFNSQSQQSQLVNRLNQMMNGMQCPDNQRMQTMVNTYADLIEQDLMARLRNGVYNGDYALGRNEDIYRVMLSRVLSQRRTQILFLPIEQVTYFATRYNDNGIGVSIMDEIKILNTLRAIVMTSNTMASVRNSIGRTKVDVKLDPNDPDPLRRAEEIRAEILRSRQTGLPIGAESFSDMATSLSLSGYEFAFSGNERMPDMTIDFSQGQSSFPKVDTEWEEQLRRRSVSATGLTVESVDNNFNGESATSVVSSNIMLSRKVMIIQDEITPHLTDHLRKIIVATPSLMEEIVEIIETKYDELDIDEEQVKELFEGEVNVKRIVVNQLIKDYLDGFEALLPRPTTVSLENQKSTLDAYVELLDQGLDSWINDELLGSELVGEISEKVRAIRSSIRSHYIRQFCAENGILTELFKIGSVDDTGDLKYDIYSEQKDYLEGLIKSAGQFIMGLTPRVVESNAVIKQDRDAVAGSDDAGGSDYSDYSSDDSGDSGDTGGDDGFGDLDMGDDTGDADDGVDDVPGFNF